MSTTVRLPFTSSEVIFRTPPSIWTRIGLLWRDLLAWRGSRRIERDLKK